MKDATRRISALLLAIVMLLTMMPVSVLGESTEEIYEPDVIFEPEYIEPGIEEEPDEEQPVITEPDKEPKEYENEGVIDPSTVSFADVEKAFAENGHAYVVSNIDVDVYADTEQTQHLCTVVKSGTIYYADKKNGSVLHVWFALANGTVMNGYISASVLDGTVIEDSNAQDLAAIGSVNTVINDASVLVFVTETADAAVQEENIEITPAIEEEIVEEMILPEAAEESTEPATEELEQEIAPVVEEEIDEEVILPEDAEETTEFVVEEPEQEIVPAVEEEIVEEVILPEDAEESSESVVEDPEQEIVPANEDETTAPETEIVPAEDLIEITPAVEDEINEKVISHETEEKTITEEIVAPAEETIRFDMEEQEEVPTAEAEEPEPIPNVEEEPVLPSPTEEDKEEIVPDEGTIGEVKNEGQQLDEISVEEIAPAIEEPEVNTAIAPASNVEIVVTSGSVPEKATASMIAYSHSQSQKLVDKWIFGIEEKPKLMMTSKKMMAASSVNIVPEIELEEEEYAEGVIVEEIPGPVQTGTHTAYAAFNVSILVDGEEYTEDGDFNVTIKPENIRLMDGIRNDATVTNVSYKMYHIHDGLEEIVINDNDVVIGEDGKVEAISFETNNFSDYIFSYTVDFYFVDPITQITTPACSIGGGDSILLSELLKCFNIDESLYGSVVEFTDPTLIQMEPVTDANGNIIDWELLSLLPFQTDEILTVTLNDGTILKINVKDDQHVAAKDVFSSWAVSLLGRVQMYGNPELNVVQVTESIRVPLNVNVTKHTFEGSQSLPAGTYTIEALVRHANLHFYVINTKHLVGSAGWDDDYAILDCYGGTALTNVVPAKRTVYFETGAENAGKQVQLIDYKGKVLETVTADKNGKATFGKYYWYEPEKAIAFELANLTREEWVKNNDCATFQSQALIAGGIAMYNPYTGGDKFLGKSDIDGMIQKFIKWRDSQAPGITIQGCFQTKATIGDFHMGDIIWCENGTMGHVMGVASNSGLEVELTAHSTSAKHVDYTDHCYIKNFDGIDYIVHLEPLTYTYKVAPTNGKVEVTKTNEKGTAMANVKFTLVGTNYSVEKTTNTSGIATWTDVPAGTYTLKETTVPAGYIKASDETIIVKPDETTKKTITNKPIMGKIKLKKTDASTGAALANAVFEVKNSSGTVVDTITTIADGTGTSKDLPYGTYTITEKTPPTGYKKWTDSKTVTISSHGQTVDVGTITNTMITGTVVVTKYRKKMYDGMQEKTLQGATLELRKAGTTTVVGAAKGTDANGQVMWTNIPFGTYDIYETKAPTGYQLGGKVGTVTVNSESITTYKPNVTNTPVYGSVRVIKNDDKGGVLPGAIFELLDATKSTKAKDINGITTTNKTTGPDGIAQWQNLEYGEYYVHEVTAPTGYQLDKGYYKVVVDKQDGTGTTGTATVTDKKIQGKIRITKTDDLTDEPIPHAKFHITCTDGFDKGNVNLDIETNAQGIAETDLLKFGTYHIVETEAPDEYCAPNYTNDVKVEKDNQGQILYTDVGVKNTAKKGKLSVEKKDALDGSAMANVQFDIYRYSNGKDIYTAKGDLTLVSSMTTGTDGKAVSGDLQKGLYVVKEHAVLTGYQDVLFTSDDLKVESDKTTPVSTEAVTNQPIQGKIKLVKTDEVTKEVMPDVTFTVTQTAGIPSKNGADIRKPFTIVTDKDGVAVTELLTYGTYVVTETVPTHYIDQNFKWTVDIHTDDKTDERTYTKDVVNKPAPGWIKVVKKDALNDNPIEGVQFDVYRYKGGATIWEKTTDKELVTTITTAKNGIGITEDLVKGCYYVVEHGKTAGYLFETVEFDEVIVKSDETTSLEAENKPVQVNITIYKRDENEYKGEIPTSSPDAAPVKANIEVPKTRGDATLEGAVFDLIAAEDVLDRQGNVVYKAGAVVETLTVGGAEASAVSKNVFPGVYKFVEKTAPEGYKPSTEEIMVDTSWAAKQSDIEVVAYEALKLNEVQTGKLRIVKIYGDNEIHTESGVLENAEEGATFQVYRTDAGSYSAARDDERDLLTTDKYGMATTKLLPYGEYTVKQLTGKEGYALKADFTVKLSGEFETEPLQKNINNQALKYYLQIIKIDEETGKTITMSGVKFKLKDTNGNYVQQTLHYPRETKIDTFETDESGTVTLPETVLYGTYHVCEFSAPEGYLITTEEVEVKVGNAEDKAGQIYTVKVNVEDKPVKGNIFINKKGLQLVGFEEMTENGQTVNKPIFEDKYLEGAVFEIYAREDIIGKDGTVWYTKDEMVDTITTTAAGNDKSKDLPLGKYYVVEVSAPDGYVFADKEYDVELKYEDDKTAYVKAILDVGNDYLKAEISAIKVKEVNMPDEQADGQVKQKIEIVPGEGFTYGLYNAEEISCAAESLPADSLVSAKITDADGKIVFSGMLPHGEYYVKEIKAADGWLTDDTKHPISVDPLLKAENEPIIRVSSPEKFQNKEKVYPVTITKTDITGEETIPGALIEITNEKGEVVYRAYTDENGEIPDIRLKPGKYEFREILAPEGYALNVAVMTFTLDEDGNVTGDTTIRDDYTRVKLSKHDTDGKLLPGVEFTMYDKDHKVFTTAVTDKDGIATFEKMPYGTFTVEETKTPEGYIPKTGALVAVVVDGTLVNPDGVIGDIINEPNEVKVKKVDQDGNVMANVKFGLYKDGKQITTATTDKNGIATFSKLPYGIYTIKEAEAVEGYLLCKTELKVTIDANYRNSTEVLGTFVNHLKRIKYIKTDTSGKYLEGVEFDLIDKATGKTVETVSSDANGVSTFTKFDYGDWIIREVTAPAGFNKMNDIELHVGDDWTEPAPFTCVNIPNHYEFVKTDNKGNPLPGVRFTLEDADGNILGDYVSDEDGIVRVTDLTPGKYVIREIETLEGFILSGDAIIVEINEKYVVPEEMYTLVNYPEPKTGVILDNPFAWVGFAVIGIALVAGWWFLIHKKYSVNHK